MNTLDYIIIGFLLLLVIRGIFRGFIREIFSLCGVIMGLWLGNHYQPLLTDLLKQYLPLPQYIPTLSFILLFIAAIVICDLLGWGLKLLVKNALEGWFDKTSGAALALIKGLLLTSIILVVLTFFFPGNKAPFISKSTLAPRIIKTYQQMTEVISADHYKKWKSKFIVDPKKPTDVKPDQSKTPDQKK